MPFKHYEDHASQVCANIVNMIHCIVANMFALVQANVLFAQELAVRWADKGA